MRDRPIPAWADPFAGSDRHRAYQVARDQVRPDQRSGRGGAVGSPGCRCGGADGRGYGGFDHRQCRRGTTGQPYVERCDRSRRGATDLQIGHPEGAEGGRRARLQCRPDGLAHAACRSCPRRRTRHCRSAWHDRASIVAQHACPDRRCGSLAQCRDLHQSRASERRGDGRDTLCQRTRGARG